MIREISVGDVLPFMKKAKKEGLTFPKKRKVRYYGYFHHQRLVGFVGVMLYRKKAVLKNDYVLPEYRRRGIYRKLCIYRNRMLRNWGYLIEEILYFTM